MLVNVVKIVIAIGAFMVIMRAGIAVLRAVSTPLPEPPPPGELRKVRRVYRCSTCGAEVRMTVAAEEEPEPPRHCQDEMDLVAVPD